MLQKVIAFLLLLNCQAFACEVKLPQQLLILESSMATVPVEAQGCSDKLLKDLQEFVATVDGKITSFQLREMLNQNGHGTVTLSPDLLQVSQLANLIRNQVLLPNGVQIKSTEAVNGPEVVSLSPGDRIEVDCSSCLFGKAQLIKVNIKAFDGNSRSIIAKVDFQKMVRAFRVVTAVSSFAEIRPSEVLKEVYVESVPYTDLVVDLTNVRFFKTNKPIKAGELLRQSDLNPVNLVKAGIKTEVVLENAMVRIKTHGISRSNGSLGDLVEVYHQQKNQKYLGKVIGHNKVLVEL